MGKRGPTPKNKLGSAVASASKPVPVKIVHEPISPNRDKDYEARERKYRAEDALRDIERAEGHKKDKQLMSDVKALAKEKANKMNELAKSVKGK